MSPEQGGSERLPPQSRDAERSVLGSMLRENSVIGDVLQIIREENFYLDAHQKVFRAITTLYERVPLHITKATHQRAAAYGMKRSDQLGRALWPKHEIAHNKHSPLVTNNLQSARHRASIAFASSHLNPPEFVNRES